MKYGISMRGWDGVNCYILADDVLIIATGRQMIGRLAQALNATHEYLQTMGATVAAATSARVLESLDPVEGPYKPMLVPDPSVMHSILQAIASVSVIG